MALFGQAGPTKGPVVMFTEPSHNLSINKIRYASLEVSAKKSRGKGVLGFSSASSMAKGRASSPPPDHEKTFSEKKIPGHEIEEIFASKKKRKKKESADSPVEDKKGGQKKMRKKKMKEKCKSKTTSSKSDEFSDLPSRPRRQTQEGLTIYRAEELGIGKSNAGGTPLCPFDCSCCF